ncbi:MAG: hypothetical protein ACREQL_03215 [Candidatus Binatia bacterium]
MIRAALVVTLAVAGACGVKSRTYPPELVQPQPPSELVAKSTVDGVRLTWRRPTTYSGGQHMRDLAGFEIDRAPGADGIAFARVGTVELTDQTRFRPERTVEWTDTTAVDGSTYRYRVIAYTLDDYRSPPGGPLTVEYRSPPPAPPKPVSDSDR